MSVSTGGKKGRYITKSSRKSPRFLLCFLLLLLKNKVLLLKQFQKEVKVILA